MASTAETLRPWDTTHPLADTLQPLFHGEVGYHAHGGCVLLEYLGICVTSCKRGAINQPTNAQFSAVFQQTYQGWLPHH